MLEKLRKQLAEQQYGEYKARLQQ